VVPFEYLVTASNMPFFILSSLVSTLLMARVYPLTTNYQLFLYLVLYPLSVEPWILLLRHFKHAPPLLIYLATHFFPDLLPLPSCRVTKIARLIAKGADIKNDIAVLLIWVIAGWMIIAKRDYSKIQKEASVDLE
jgi:hypothetical protein